MTNEQQKSLSKEGEEHWENDIIWASDSPEVKAAKKKRQKENEER